jgi:hypothetical protein
MKMPRIKKPASTSKRPMGRRKRPAPAPRLIPEAARRALTYPRLRSTSYTGFGGYRIPGDEREPDVEPGEVVVFTAHFVRGLGLPASYFFQRFLNFYKLQPHHLPGNAVFYLSAFVSFMEGYVGLTPTTRLLPDFIISGSTPSKILRYRSPSPFFRAGRA